MSSRFFLVFLLMVPYTYATLNATTEAVNCIEKWLNSKAKGTTNQIHCTRLKVCVDCLSEPSIGSSDVLTDFRYIVEQEAVLAEKYGICGDSPVNFTALKELVTNTGVKEGYQNFTIDNDKVEPCALQVHQKCIKYWIDIFEDKKMCKDFSKFVQCLHKRNNKTGCRADTIRHLIAMYDSVGNDFVEKVRQHMGYECHENERK